ncbi:MAG TPA: DUF1848 domain-containing protein [Thermoleophilia bacterium]|nr:DUF1848 domain-containing protein [Thermoleophilia bacterium]
MTGSPRVVSASRRTDIPAFYSDWFVRRLREGYCHWMNPFGGQVYRVSLRAEDCLALILWTRNVRPLLPHLEELTAGGHRFYFHYTVNGYPREVDPHAPPLGAAAVAFRGLAEAVSPERVMWRYDPVVFGSTMLTDYHVERFDTISAQLAGLTTRCYLSFVDMYGKTQRNVDRANNALDLGLRRPSAAEQRDLLAKLAPIAAKRGLTLHACCDAPSPDLGVRRARCIDPEVIDRLGTMPHAPLKAAPTRTGCGCVEAVDIGAYDTCVFGCVYCYATNSREAAIGRRSRHDPADSILWRPQSLQGVDLAEVEYVPRQTKRPRRAPPLPPQLFDDPSTGAGS